jgi:hypothetical protein
MNIQVTITLNADDAAGNLPGNAASIAEAVLSAAGGDPEKDTCNVSIMDYGAHGAGAPAPTLLPATPPTPSAS